MKKLIAIMLCVSVIFGLASVASATEGEFIGTETMEVYYDVADDTPPEDDLTGGGNNAGGSDNTNDGNNTGGTATRRPGNSWGIVDDGRDYDEEETGSFVINIPAKLEVGQTAWISAALDFNDHRVFTVEFAPFDDDNIVRLFNQYGTGEAVEVIFESAEGTQYTNANNLICEWDRNSNGMGRQIRAKAVSDLSDLSFGRYSGTLQFFVRCYRQ